MKIGQTIECQACGASSVTVLANKPLLECEYCGATMTYSLGTPSVSPTAHVQHKPAKLALMMVLIPMGVIILMVVFWQVFQNIRKHTSIGAYEVETTEVTVPLEQTSTNPNTLIQPATSSQQSTPSETAESLGEQLSIQSQVSGVTSNGGKYWILGVKNNGNQRLARPGVMLSLFDQAGKRLEEQSGWAMREVLEPGQQTTVLLFLSDVPPAAVDQQIKTFASQSTQLGLNQVEVKVFDFTVITKNKQFELIGDVINNQESQVKYVRLMAVAYDSDGKPIGMGNAFSTDKDLAPNQRSGFKVKVGTFLVGEPDTWRVWALGRD